MRKTCILCGLQTRCWCKLCLAALCNPSAGVLEMRGQTISCHDMFHQALRRGDAIGKRDVSKVHKRLRNQRGQARQKRRRLSASGGTEALPPASASASRATAPAATSWALSSMESLASAQSQETVASLDDATMSPEPSRELESQETIASQEMLESQETLASMDLAASPVSHASPLVAVTQAPPTRTAIARVTKPLVAASSMAKRGSGGT